LRGLRAKATATQSLKPETRVSNQTPRFSILNHTDAQFSTLSTFIINISCVPLESDGEHNAKFSVPIWRHPLALLAGANTLRPLRNFPHRNQSRRRTSSALRFRRENGGEARGWGHRLRKRGGGGGGGGGGGRRGRTLVSNEIRATSVDRVLGRGLSTREAGHRVQPKLRRHTLASIICSAEMRSG